jgi:hypothetical protein
MEISIVLNNDIILDAKEAGAIYLTCWMFIEEELAAFAAIRDARKDAEIARLREALAYIRNEIVNPPEGLSKAFIQNVILGTIDNALAQGEQNGS